MKTIGSIGEVLRLHGDLFSQYTRPRLWMVERKGVEKVPPPFRLYQLLFASPENRWWENFRAYNRLADIFQSAKKYNVITKHRMGM